MKKLLTLVMAVLLVAFAGVTAFAADTPICGFDADDIAAFMNYNTGLANYQVADPIVTAADGDDGKGVRIQGETAASWVQGFNVSDEAFITALKTGVTTNKYLKMYVNNPSQYPFGLRLTFIDEEWLNVASFDASHCVLAAKDGYKREIATADGGGMGANSAIVIPAGFDGYVYFDCANVTIPYPFTNSNGEAVSLMTDFSKIHTLEIDLRWNVAGTFAGGADVVFDSLKAVDEITEQLVDPTPAPTPEATATPEITEPEATEKATASQEPSVAPSQSVEPADDASNDSTVIIIIAVVAVIVVAVVVILVVKNKKKAA